MYKITTTTATEYSEAPIYVRMQGNGVPVLCRGDMAQGVLSKDRSSIYAFAGTALDNGAYTTCVLKEIPLEQFIDEYIGDAVNALIGTEVGTNGQSN